MQPTPERRRTSSHYTPRSLTTPIVSRTLGPLVAAMGPEPASDRLLELKICDPAMGSGAFLVEACRWLADQLVAAWTREGRLEWVADAHEDVVNHARRLVAQRCLYGVDKNPLAVTLAKLSLWLVTLARDLPFTFVDHALRHGDSLVGLDLEQIQSFHWKPSKQLTFVSALLQEVLDQAIVDRQRILELADATSPADWREKVRLLRDAEDALEPVRIVGDLVVGAFFSAEKDRDREKERLRRMELVRAWLAGDGPVPDELRVMSEAIRERIPVFHWMAEFPEVFWAQRPDPLAGERTDGVAWMEAFVGNPPFAGKNGVLEAGGPGYIEWLQAVHEGAHGNADLSAHFFRRAAGLLGSHGTIGLIATNTIAQGDTRATGLQRLVADGFEISAGTRSMPWPGTANVTVSVVHLAKGSTVQAVRERVLDERVVPAIDSRLRGKPERPDPVKLAANAGLAFVGSYVLGMGFTLTPAERDALVAKDPRNAERIFPYLGGEEVNTNPDQGFDRYVINFGTMSLEEAERWPDLLAIVREKVKPSRDLDNRDVRRKFWWRFGEVAPGLYEAVRPFPRCLVTSQVSKHLLFSWQPTQRVYSHALYVLALQSNSALAVLQSRVHATWAILLASSMKSDPRYIADDCFRTFPFPTADPRTVVMPLEEMGNRLEQARRAFLVGHEIGLTRCYNRLKDSTDTDPEVVALRLLHIDLDQAVLDAYGWSDIAVPPYTTPDTEAGRKALEYFEDEVVDRLFVLNAGRASIEALHGAVPGKK
ncbi:MAG: DNA methyltransferase, partial [Myxococcota bacterium]